MQKGEGVLSQNFFFDKALEEMLRFVPSKTISHQKNATLYENWIDSK